MREVKFKSYAKINLSLSVIKKKKSGLHQIESLVTFTKLFDEIKIQENKDKRHIVKFNGKFSSKINKKNTVNKLLKILDQEELLKNKKFIIKVKKNIPPKSGLGGGSMNAASIINFFKTKSFININQKKLLEISKAIGSDVELGLKQKNTILFSNGKIRRNPFNLNLFVIIVRPNFGCSTKEIYKNVKKFSKKQLISSNKKIFIIKNILKSKNDLEDIVLKKYPKTQKLKKIMYNLPKVLFVRMTGSGSCFVAYFKSKNASINASKILKKKYKNYWCVTSKTI